MSAKGNIKKALLAALVALMVSHPTNLSVNKNIKRDAYNAVKISQFERRQKSKELTAKKQTSPRKSASHQTASHQPPSHNSYGIISNHEFQIIKERSKKYEKYFEEASKKYGIPIEFLVAISYNESSVGAASKNIMQITGIAEKEIHNLGYKRNDIYTNPESNITAAALLLKHYKKILEDNFSFDSPTTEYEALALSYRHGVFGVMKHLKNFAGKTITSKEMGKLKMELDSKERYSDKAIDIMQKYQQSN